MAQFRFVADEDFDNRILRCLLRRLPDLDIVRIQDVGLAGAHDQAILAWADEEQRVREGPGLVGGAAGTC